LPGRSTATMQATLTHRLIVVFFGFSFSFVMVLERRRPGLFAREIYTNRYKRRYAPCLIVVF